MHPDRWTPAVKKREDEDRSLKGRIMKWSEKPAPPTRQIRSTVKVKTDKGIEERPAMQAGWADPERYFEQKRGLHISEPDATPKPAALGIAGQASKALLGQMSMSEIDENGKLRSTATPPEPVPGMTETEQMNMKALEVPMAAATVMNDVGSRIGSLRRDLVDKPLDETDDPTMVLETPKGNSFTQEQKLAYYKMLDGTIVERTQLEEARKEDPISYKTPKGRVLSLETIKGARSTRDPKDYLIINDPKDPRRKGLVKQEDGNYYYPIRLELPDGTKIARTELEPETLTAYEWMLSDGRPLREEAIPAQDDAAAWQQAFYEWRAPDQTVLMKADGSVPENMQKPHMSEAGDHGPLNLGLSNPRAPWQDTSGKNLWDKGYDPEKSTIDEILPWFIDANLSSAPYYIPQYNVLAAGASAAPFLAGYDGNAYQPVGGWGNVGNGVYMQDKPLTNAQATGGAAAAFIGAAAERIPWEGLGSGKAIGGIPIPFLEKLAGRRIARLGSAALTEGVEEILASPPQHMMEQGLVNYGRPRYMNESTGDWEYDEKAPAGPLSPTATSAYLADFSAGAALGAGTDLAMQGVDVARNGWKGPTLPSQPKVAQAQKRKNLPMRTYQARPFKTDGDW